MIDLKSSVGNKGPLVTKIYHFAHGEKKTIHGVKTDTIEQGEFVKYETDDGRMILVNTDNVNLVEIFKEK